MQPLTQAAAAVAVVSVAAVVIPHVAPVVVFGSILLGVAYGLSRN